MQSHTQAGYLFTLLKEYWGQIKAAGGQGGGGQLAKLIHQLGIWFTLQQEDEGQIEAAGGQEGKGQMCNPILKLAICLPC